MDLTFSDGDKKLKQRVCGHTIAVPLPTTKGENTLVLLVCFEAPRHRGDHAHTFRWSNHGAQDGGDARLVRSRSVERLTPGNRPADP